MVGSFIHELEEVLQSRREERPEESYSLTLIDDPVFAQRKIMEEAFEVCLELGVATPDVDRTVEEAADLVFHLLAGLVGAGASWSDVESTLQERHGRGTQS